MGSYEQPYGVHFLKNDRPNVTNDVKIFQQIEEQWTEAKAGRQSER